MYKGSVGEEDGFFFLTSYRYIIDNEKPCIVIANKADKIAVTKVDAQVNSLQDLLNPLKDFTLFYTDKPNKSHLLEHFSP